jgi:hypothetical protein
MPLKVASPAPDVLTALVAVLTANAPLQAILSAPGIYSGRAPNSAQLSYVVVTDTTGGAAPTFDGKIGRGSFRLNLWAKDLPACLALYRAVALVIDGTALNLGATLKMVTSKCELTTTIPDPSANAGVQGIVNYEWMAQVVA